MHRWAVGKPLMPKEHGAWAVLYGSLLAGVGVAGRMTVPVALLFVGVSALALASGALGLLCRMPAGEEAAERRRHARAWLLLYGSAAAAALGPLLVVWRLDSLVGFGLVAAAFLLTRGILVHRRDERTLFGELAGIAGLTMVGPVAHAEALGEVQPTGLALWPLLFLFFASGVFYVRMRIQWVAARRKGSMALSRPSRRACLLYHLLLVVLAPLLAELHVVPWLALLGFVPAVWRAASGLHVEEPRLDLRRLGWSETALAASFVLLLIGAFQLHALLG